MQKTQIKIPIDHKSLYLLATTMIFIVLASCSKDEVNPNLPSPVTPILTGIDPDTGAKGTLISINGKDFTTDTSQVTVFFNNKEAVVQSVAKNQIKAVVPSGAGTGMVKVVINGTELAGPEFMYLLSTEVGTLAGGAFGFADGTGANAQFGFPVGVAVDASGNVYVAERANHKIRKITPEGETSTLAGSTRGFADGPGANAQFDHPFGIAVDASGNVYAGDQVNNRIRKITPNGMVSTFAGGARGFADGAGSTALFDSPSGVAVDASGNVYVADADNHKIRKITPGGVVSTLAGSTKGFADGTGVEAKFLIPIGVAVDGAGNVFVAERGGHKIRKVTPEGAVSTLAGSVQGADDGTGGNALFNIPLGVGTDASGNVYVADWKNHRIRKVTPGGVVSTLAGSGIGFADGSAPDAKFNEPIAVAADVFGNIYVADNRNHKIRKITQE